MRISHLFLAAITVALASASFGYVREFDNGTPLAWVKDVNLMYAIFAGIVLASLFYNTLIRLRKNLFLFETGAADAARRL